MPEPLLGPRQVVWRGWLVRKTVYAGTYGAWASIDSAHTACQRSAWVTRSGIKGLTDRMTDEPPSLKTPPTQMLASSASFFSCLGVCSVSLN